jgi:3-oxoacyl-[acyl-carrier-protein] synthase-1
VGVVTAVGTTAEQSFTSIRAGLRRVSERPLAGAGGDPGEEGGTYMASGAEGVAAALGVSGAGGLALHAAREALFDAGLYESRDVESAYRRSAVAVLLAVPYADAPAADPTAAFAFRDALEAAGLVERGKAEVVAVPGGHAAGIMALQAAAARLLAGTVDVALVGGLDAMLHPRCIAEMNTRGKLRTDRAPGGAIPGEGSAFVTLERVDDARRRKAAVYAAVEATSSANEPDPFDGEKPNRGEGASKAVRGALSAAPSAGRITDVFVDLNGERGRFLEWALVETRCLSTLQDGWRRHVPASIVGDLGAASGVLLIALAAHTVRLGRPAGGAALVCSAAERGERGAAVLGAPGAAGRG